jgi:hypothetical protein
MTSKNVRNLKSDLVKRAESRRCLTQGLASMAYGIRTASTYPTSHNKISWPALTELCPGPYIQSR